MAIELRMTFENVEEMRNELSSLAKVGLPVAPEVIREGRELKADEAVNPLLVDSVDAPVANGPVVQFPEAKAPRRGRPPKVGTNEPEDEAPSAKKHISEAPVVVTPDDCIEAVKSLVSRTGDILAPGHVLGGFGVKKTRELTDTQRAGFVAACAAYVAEGAAGKGAQ
jgi:hypothetical protein